MFGIMNDSLSPIAGKPAARPSGTENILKIYAESLISQVHLDTIVAEARRIVDNALAFSTQGVWAAKGDQ
jgi:phosphoglucomutase